MASGTVLHAFPVAAGRRVACLVDDTQKQRVEIMRHQDYENIVCCVLASEDRASRHRRQDVMPDPGVAATRRARTCKGAHSSRAPPPDAL